MQLVERFNLFFGGEIAAARGLQPGMDCGSLVVGWPVHTAATGFDFTNDLGKLLLILDWPGLNPFQQGLGSRAHHITPPSPAAARMNWRSARRSPCRRAPLRPSSADRSRAAPRRRT